MTSGNIQFGIIRAFTSHSVALKTQQKDKTFTDTQITMKKKKVERCAKNCDTEKGVAINPHKNLLDISNVKDQIISPGNCAKNFQNFAQS